MSEAGKLYRGEKWEMQRDKFGVLPIGISNDPNKMEDVNFFLNSKKTGFDTDLSSMTKKGLSDLATEKGLDITNAKTKDDLIVILENKTDLDAKPEVI